MTGPPAGGRRGARDRAALPQHDGAPAGALRRVLGQRPARPPRPRDPRGQRGVPPRRGGPGRSPRRPRRVRRRAHRGGDGWVRGATRRARTATADSRGRSPERWHRPRNPRSRASSPIEWRPPQTPPPPPQEDGSLWSWGLNGHGQIGHSGDLKQCGVRFMWRSAARQRDCGRRQALPAAPLEPRRAAVVDSPTNQKLERWPGAHRGHSAGPHKRRRSWGGAHPSAVRWGRCPARGPRPARRRASCRQQQWALVRPASPANTAAASPAPTACRSPPRPQRAGRSGRPAATATRSWGWGTSTARATPSSGWSAASGGAP